MDFPTIVSTAGLVNNAINVLKNARDLAKDTSDTELKEKISEVYDAMLDLKDRVLTLDEENRTLKAQVVAKAAYVGPEPPHGYYYAATDDTKTHPLCPMCYQSNPPKIGFLEGWDTGRRRCKLCHNVFDEKRGNASSPKPLRSYDPYNEM